MKNKITAIITAALVSVLLIIATVPSIAADSLPETATEPASGSPEQTVVTENQTQNGTKPDNGGPSSASLTLPTGSQLVAGYTGGSLAHYAIIQAKSGGSILSNGSVWICIVILVVTAGVCTVLIVRKKKKSNKDSAK